MISLLGSWASPRGPLLLPLVAAAAVFAADLVVTPLGLPITIFYVAPILIGLWIPEPRFPIVMAGIVTPLISAGLLFSPGERLWLGLVNRLPAIILVWGTAALVMRFRHTSTALVAKNRLAQQYLDVAGVILLVLNRQGRIELINRRGCDVLGVREVDALGRHWFQTFLPERVRRDVEAVFHEMLAGRVEPLEHYENPVLTRAGDERMIVWHNTILRDAAGRVTGTLSSGEDVTARKGTEVALEQSLKDLADVKYALDQSAIVAATDTRGIIKYANDKFCEISKYSRDELIGQDHRIINSGYHPKEFMRNLWFTIASGHIWRGEIRNRAKDGSYYWVDTTIVPFLDASGKPYQYMAIRSDITERKRAEARLQEQETLARLGEMAAIVAHEVKNPLAGIRGALQIIGTRMAPESRDRPVVGDVVARIDALNELVQDLLAFAKPRAPQSSPVALRSLIESTVALLEKDPALAATKVKYAGDAPTIHADAEQLQRVFQNLLLNAAQAMSGHGQIHVFVKSRNGRCEVIVRDHGPGIPLEVRQRLFQPFVTTKHRGTGLGLAIARRIVELHQGTIHADCPPEGGTVITISLPGVRV